jgi:single-stranded-DNA-specific exonuclease
LYGDYDVDGVCATAILWETLHPLSSQIKPFIPHREKDGYGLSQSGIDACLSQGAKLIITLDNGIVAHEQIAYCRQQGCDVVIIDHHTISDNLPDANFVLHSTSCSAAGLAWFFSRDFIQLSHLSPASSDHLSLAAMATICDLVPLLGTNRSLVAHGLTELRSTTRPGLQALFKLAGIEQTTIDPYHVGYIIGPRLNAMGRLEHAMDSLRLLCTPNPVQAAELANLLHATNLTRQSETESAISHATSLNPTGDVLVVASETYHPGVIGLVAAKLTEKFYRPSIAISIGPVVSKGSARSISGFNITDHIRQFSSQLVNVGGHAMAAGFTIDNKFLTEFIAHISQASIDPNLFIRPTRVDMELPLDSVTLDLYYRLAELAPFGLGNPTPTFSTSGVSMTDPRRIGQDGKHLKFRAGELEAIYFNAPLGIEQPTSNISIIYSLTLNTFNGKTSLQLNIKSISNN